MRELVSYTDFLVICTARNERQARAIVDEVRLQAEAARWACCPAASTAAATRAGSCSTTSTASCTSSPRRRGERYQLEDLWREAPRLELDLDAKPRPQAPDLGGRSAPDEMPSEGPLTVPRMGSFKRVALRLPPSRSGRGDFGTGQPDQVLERRLPSASGRLRRSPSSRRSSPRSRDGDRARARDPRPDRAAARGQRAPRPQHRLARRGLRRGWRRSRRRPAARRPGSG